MPSRSRGNLTQHDIDSWYAEGPSTRQHAERFLYWCRSQRLTPKLDVPQHRNDNHQVIGQHERLQIIRTLLLSDDLALPYRIAGCLVMLYGQPAGRIAALTIDDVQVDAGAVRIRLARDWIGVPEPLATLLTGHLAQRPNLNTAANPISKWLFPGGMPSQHLNSQTLLDTLRGAGIPVLASRNTTWQQLVREAPPQVLADALGISPATAMLHAEHAGSDWARYAADRCRQD